MADFTSVTDGNWNDGATWGNTSPGTKGTHWPGLSGDTATISVGDTVTYNVSETNTMGNVTVNGTLTFSTSMSTLLHFGHNVLSIADGGEVLVGSEGSPLSSSYTCRIMWSPTSNYGGLLSWDGDGLMRLYGDSGLYGSKPTAYLQSDWTSGQTFTINGDYTSDWGAGLWLAVCRGGTSEISYTTAGDFFSIASVSANGGNTDITINETAPGVTFAAGSDVIVLSRNIELGKYWTTAPFGWNDDTTTLTPSHSHSVDQTDTIITGTNVNVLKEVWLQGWYNPPYLTHCTSGESVVWSANYGNMNILSNYHTDAIAKDIYWIGNGGDLGVYDSHVENLWSFGNNYGLPNCYRSSVTGIRVYGVSHFGTGWSNSYLQGYVYGVASYFLYNNHGEGTVFTGTIQKDERGNSYWGPDYYIYLPSSSPSASPLIHYNVDKPASEYPVYGRNSNSLADHHVIFENFDQTEGSHLIVADRTTQSLVSADNTSGRPDQRSGGSDKLVQIFWENAYTAYDDTSFMPDKISMLDHKLWAETGTPKTYRYYVQSGYTANMDRSNIRLVARSLGGSEVSTSEVTARTGSTDWSQYLEVTLTPTVSYWVILEVWVAFAVETDKYVWIDPKLEIR